jgi:hypothetical protein
MYYRGYLGLASNSFRLIDSIKQIIIDYFVRKEVTYECEEDLLLGDSCNNNCLML